METVTVCIKTKKEKRIQSKPFSVFAGRWPTWPCQRHAPHTEMVRDLNQSTCQIRGCLTLTAWLFSSLSAPFPFTVCQQRLCLLLSHGTAQEAWEKKKSYLFTLVYCHGNQPTVVTLRQKYTGKVFSLGSVVCTPLCFRFVFIFQPFAPHSGAPL